jgi:Protein of unknown function (DUF4197)
MKTNKILILTLVISLGSCSTLGKMALKPSTWETIAAIKDILNSSVFKALSGLQKLHSDNPENALPKEIQPVLATLKTLGYGDEVGKITKSVGNASGIALNEGKGIMADAIKEVDLGDAVSIVLGGEDAATTVFKTAMKAAVKKRYSATLNSELSKTDALKYWPIAAGAFNVFAKNKVDVNLSDFLAEKAVDGMFLAMGKEEKAIRQNPASIGSSVVTKVFDYYKKNKS